jgi:predicted enzyme related to lactoylglutathione lyase
MAFQRRQLLRILPLGLGAGFIFNRKNVGLGAQTAPQSRSGTAVGQTLAKASEMEKVAGIGGLFFRAHDPVTLARWYQQHLGINLTPSSYQDAVWQQEQGPTVFAPFPETSDYFGDPHKAWMVNFRVRDLDKMAAQLKAAGIEVKIDPQSYPNGRFARLHDPEGNPIELWEAKVPPSH